jgi:glutamyl-tRNA reductase
LSTCNRTEAYVVTAGDTDIEALCLDVLRNVTDVDELAAADTYFAVDAYAGAHLMRVASGLDSQVLGEHEILGQVKAAHALARDAGTLGTILDRLFTSALRAAKRVRTETKIGRGAGSVASAGIVLAEKVLGSLSGTRALVIGAGETGTLAARHLAKRGLAELCIANRTPSRAITVAHLVHGRAVAMEDLPQLLGSMDLVICATSARNQVVTAAMVEKALRDRRNRGLVLIDLAMPRNVDPSAANCENVVVYGLDSLNVVVRASLAQRQQEAALAERIVVDEIDELDAWLRGRAAMPLVLELRDHFERIRVAELDRSLKDCPPDERANLERVTRSIVNKLLQAPTVCLKTVNPHSPSGLCWAETVQALFAMRFEALTTDIDAVAQPSTVQFREPFQR